MEKQVQNQLEEIYTLNQKLKSQREIHENKLNSQTKELDFKISSFRDENENLTKEMFTIHK